MTALPTSSVADLPSDLLARAVRDAERLRRSDSGPAESARGAAPAFRRLAGAARRLVAGHPVLFAGGALALGLAAGFGAGALSARGDLPTPVPAASLPVVMDWGPAAPLVIRQAEMDSLRLAGEVRGLATRVNTLRTGLDGARDNSAREIGTRLAPVTERLARMEKLGEEDRARLAQALERLGTDSKTQIAPLADRLERIEKQLAALAAKTPMVTGSLGEGAAPAKPVPVEVKPAKEAEANAEGRSEVARTDAVLPGWTLRGIDRGVAILEGRRGLIEVRPGQTVPGAGRVTGFERRGRDWVVVTQKGLIAAEPW